MTSKGQRDATKKLDRFEKPVQDSMDRPSEFSRLLQIRKLEVRNSPFRGFDSPPGRF